MEDETRFYLAFKLEIEGLRTKMIAFFGKDGNELTTASLLELR